MESKERRSWKDKAPENIKDFVSQAYKHAEEIPCPIARLRTFTDQARRETCGECVICREGVLQLFTMTEGITQGIGRDGDIEVLSEIADNLVISANCDYGKEVGKIAKKIIHAELEQFEKHIKRKRCDSLICKKFFSYYIVPEKCSGCNRCVGLCDKEAILGSNGLIHIINQTACNRCGECVTGCESEAIQKTGEIILKIPSKPIPVGSFQAETSGGLMSQKRRRRSE